MSAQQLDTFRMALWMIAHECPKPVEVAQAALKLIEKKEPCGECLDMPSQPQNGLGPCPHCFESCGYQVEHGNDWNTGPYTHITAIPCRVCEGTGHVPMEDATDAELLEYFDGAFEALTA